MKLLSLLSTTIVVLATALSVANGQDTSQKYKPIQSARGRAFPAPERKLIKLRDDPKKVNIAKMRAHAWDLFLGLTKGDPAWQTWYTKCDLKLAVQGCPTSSVPGLKAPATLLRSFEIPVQSLHFLEQLYTANNATPQTPAASVQLTPFQRELKQFISDFRAHPQFASVLFNQEAANHILSNCLYPHVNNSQVNNTIPCPSIIARNSEIRPFARGSIIVKTVWQVAHMNPALGPRMAGPLDTWDSALWNEVHPPNTILSSFSKKTVTIDTTDATPCQDKDYNDNDKIPLSCFFSIPLNVDNIKTFPRVLAAIDDQHLVPGDYLVLMGMHVTTKEIPEWVWATFWWDNHAFSDRRAGGRPPALGKRWKHFLMSTTLSGMTPSATDGGPNITFNPYLETDVRITNGIVSNCVQCHSRAGYGDRDKLNRAYDLGILGRDGKTLASGKAAEPGYFEHLTTTDFIWSLSSPQDSLLKTLLDGMAEMAELSIKGSP